jgi:phosphoglycolate phosphatase-like HAD superfamily hydrolase
MSHPFVIFDLVATVVDAGPRYVAAYRQVCEMNGFTAPNNQLVLDMLGERNLSQIMERTLPPMDEPQRQSFMSQCNVTCDALLLRSDWREHLFPGILPCFESLKQKGIEIGLSSGIRQDALIAQCDYHALEKFVKPPFIQAKTSGMDSVTDHVELKKHLLLAQQATFVSEFSVAPEKTLYVGDSPADFEAAREVNMDFVGVAWTPRQFDKLHASGCDIIVRDFADLQGTILRQLNQPQAIKLHRKLSQVPVQAPVLLK